MATSVEAPLTLLQKPVEVLRFDAIVFAHMPLGLVPEILDPIDVVLPRGEALGVIDSPMMEV